MDVFEYSDLIILEFDVATSTYDVHIVNLRPLSGSLYRRGISVSFIHTYIGHN